MNFKILILFLYFFRFSDSLIHDNDDNPFKLIHDGHSLDDEYSPDDDDDDNPFSLVYVDKNKPQITEAQFKSDLLAHSHLVKILWNKIEKSEINQSNEVHLKLSLTADMINDIKTYINTSNQSFSILINQHFLNNFIKVEEKKEIIFNYENDASWFQNPYSRLMLILFTAICTAKWPRIGVMVIVGFGVWHMDYTLQKEAEVRQQFMVNKPLPEHCKHQGSSKWYHWFSWKNDEECFKLFKEINLDKKFGDNPLKVIAELVSSTFVVLIKPAGELTGNIYTGLKGHMYSPMALIVLAMLLFFLAFFCLGVFFIHRRVPKIHADPPFVEEPNRHNREYHIKLHGTTRRKQSKMIDYKKY